MRTSPFFLSLILAASLSFASGCTRQISTSSPPQSVPQSSARVVNLAIWSNYVTPEMIQAFEDQTGIKVQVSNYSSNEELLAKIQAGASGYDVVVPSDYMVFAMTKLGHLKELNYQLLPNAKTLDPRFLKKPFDPTNKYSVPFDWGTTGIAVNRTLYKGQIKGWKDLLTNGDLTGKFTLLDDVRETLGAALKSLGFSLNSKNPAELAKAKELLIQARKRVKGFTSEPKMPLANSETAVAHVYMSDALQAAKASGGKVEYFLPEEGATLWIDNLVIPASAAHVKEAHEFINYLINPKISAGTVMAVMVGPASKDIFGLLPKEYQENKILFPQDKVFSKLEMMEDLGDATTLWDRVWTEVKAGQ